MIGGPKLFDAPRAMLWSKIRLLLYSVLNIDLKLSYALS